MNISTKSKKEIYKILLSFDDPFQESENNWIFNFLESIWDIDNMPSTDDRFSNARDDIYQHMINNDDWGIDFLFIDRLDLFGDNSIFSEFISKILQNVIDVDEQLSQDTALEINSILEKDGLQLFVSDYMDGYPVYNFDKFDPDSTPVTFKVNNYIFFVHLTPESSGINNLQIRNVGYCSF